MRSPPARFIAYNPLDQLTSSATDNQTTTYTYDGRGNLTGTSSGNGAHATTASYTYDAADRQTGATLSSGFSASYAYDADGRRVKQTVGSSVTNSLWDEASAYGDVVTESDGSGAIQASYVLGGGELLAQVRGSGASGVASYMLPDGQGSVRALANSAGAITDTYRYDAYGTLTASTGTTPNPYRYDGQRLDDGTGLYQLRARSYDPGTGRFLSRDTAAMDLTNPIELNRYEYAQDDPINFLDPSGREALPDYAFEIEEDEEVIVPPRSPIPTIARRIGEILLVMALALTLPSDSPLPGPVASPRPRPRPLPQPQPQPQPQPSPAPVPLPAPTPDPSKRQHCPISSENDFIHANSKGRGGRALQVFGKVRGPEGGDADCHVNVQVDPPDVNLHVRLEQSGFYTANGAQIGEEGNECGMRDYVCAANVVSSQQAKYFASRTQDDFWTQERVFAWFLEQTEPRFLALQLFPSRIAP